MLRRPPRSCDRKSHWPQHRGVEASRWSLLWGLTVAEANQEATLGFILICKTNTSTGKDASSPVPNCTAVWGFLFSRLD